MNITFSSVIQWVMSLTKPYPARDWLIVVLVATLVGLSGVWVAGYLFWGTQTGTLINAATEVPRAPIPVSRDTLKSVLESYQQRAANYAAKSFVVVDLVDPRPRTVKK